MTALGSWPLVEQPNQPSGDRAPATSTSLGVAVGALAILNAVLLVLGLTSWTPVKGAMKDIGFPATWDFLVPVALGLALGGAFSFLDRLRNVGAGILLVVGGLTLSKWTALSLHFYYPQGNPYYGLFNGQVTSPDTLVGLIGIVAGLGLCVACAASLFTGDANRANQATDRAGTRVLFGCAAVSALGYYFLWAYLPGQYIFLHLDPIGNILDVIGLVAIVAPLALLAFARPTFRTAVTVVVTWLAMGTFSVSFAGINYLQNWTSSGWRTFQGGQWLLGPLLIILVGVFGIIACAMLKKPYAPSFHEGFGSAYCGQGHLIPYGSPYCPQCGSMPVPGFGQSSMVATMATCPNGHAVSTGDSFCGECGQVVPPNAFMIQPAMMVPVAWAPSNAPGYASPAYPPNTFPMAAGVVQSTNGFAIAALITGLLGASALSISFGFVARSQIRRSMGRQKGGGMAMAGIVLGFVWLVLGIALWIVIFVVLAHVNNGYTNVYTGTS